jgi:hypothetical protein
MLLKEMHCKKRTRVCNAADSTDDESDGMHCNKKARICNATDSTDDASDDTAQLKICVGGGSRVGLG